MHIGFRKDFSKKTESFGGRGVGRRERMKDKCKVGSLNIFFAFRLPTYHYLFNFSLPHFTSSSAARSIDK